MTEKPKYSGLCETCDYDATCTLRRSTQLKIIQCEEFSVQSSSAKPIARQQALDSDLNEAQAPGLCSNCLHVLTCGFPNARRGVVTCEEYLLDEAGVITSATDEHSRSAA